MESPWSSSGQFTQDSPHCGSSLRSKTWWLKWSVNLSTSKDELSSCQCITTLYGERKETKNCVLRIPKNVADYARWFAHGHWSFLGPGSDNKWHGTHTYKPNGEGDHVAEDIMINFSESGHPVFRGSSALERRSLRSKGGFQIQSKWFFARLFPSISPVCTEQWRTCVTNWLRGFLIVQKVQGDL